jgi:uroporphyrin-3 C-methyltransferase
VTDDPTLPQPTRVAPAIPVPSPAAPPASAAGRWAAALALVMAVLAAIALAMAWTTNKRVRSLERELVQRQQASQAEATTARTLARAAEDSARDAAAKVALLEARVAESSLQRSQLEELIQSLSRSRDETVLGDVEAAVRVAIQQSAITGSAEPLVATLKQAEERLARYNQPRLERVRRAVARDLERVKSVALSDISTLVIRLDEAVRQVDELPLLAVAEPRRPAPARGSAAAMATPGPAASSPASAPAGWTEPITQAWQGFTDRAWDEVRALVRVTRIDNPEAVLVAPEQAFFLRENMKLRLLNARLAVLSRQFDIAQADLRDVQNALDRYFDRSSRRVVATSELVRQVGAQARLVTVPRPDETLAALAAAGQ